MFKHIAILVPAVAKRFHANVRTRKENKKQGKGNITNPFVEHLLDIKTFTKPGEFSSTWLLEYLDVFDMEKN
jgi:hypothetical protein